MFFISSDFIGDFKLGDNINYNLGTLALLYRYFEDAGAQERLSLRKPIIILMASIAEAVLHDFHNRIKTFTVEGVRNLASDVIEYVQGKKLDEFEKYISSARRHDFFELGDTNFYDRLHELRKLRNRIHIQNTNNDFERDDSAAFNQQRMLMAERVLEKTLRIMATKYPRDLEEKYVADFSLPWEPRFPND